MPPQSLRASGAVNAEPHGQDTSAKAGDQQTSPLGPAFTVRELQQISSALGQQARLLGIETPAGALVASFAMRIVTHARTTGVSSCATPAAQFATVGARGETPREHVANALMILEADMAPLSQLPSKVAGSAAALESVKQRLRLALAQLDVGAQLRREPLETMPGSWRDRQLPTGDDR